MSKSLTVDITCMYQASCREMSMVRAASEEGCLFSGLFFSSGYKQSLWRLGDDLVDKVLAKQV